MEDTNASYAWEQIEMKSHQLILVLLVVAVMSSPLFGGISVRAGLSLPQGDFKDYAATGWSAEILADIHPFSAPFLSVPVMVNLVSLGEKESDWFSAPETGPGDFTQMSSVTLTGGGIGLKFEPPIPAIRPFAEVFGRLASIEQEYDSGLPDEGKVIESKTKFGVQIDGGLQYSFVPTTSLLIGASYTTFFDVNLFSENVEEEVSVNTIGVFVGMSFSVGW
jgi:opacity protein-like surface antigen